MDYKIYNTGGSSEVYGICELCDGLVLEVSYYRIDKV